MNLEFIESLLDKVAKPERVEMKLLDRKYLLIQSAENTMIIAHAEYRYSALTIPRGAQVEYRS